jgi:hypothetical protein
MPRGNAWQAGYMAYENSDICKSLFAFAKRGVAAFSGFFQQDRKGLIDRFFVSLRESYYLLILHFPTHAPVT